MVCKYTVSGPAIPQLVPTSDNHTLSVHSIFRQPGGDVRGYRPHAASCLVSQTAGYAHSKNDNLAFVSWR